MGGVLSASRTKERVMESMVVSRLSATLASLPARRGAPPSLAAAFTLVPDPRRSASVTYPLAAVLALAVAALLANHSSVLAIAEWGRRQGEGLLARFGFPDGRAPCQSTLQRLFRRLDPDAISAALSAHLAPTVAPDPAARGAQGVAIDGKAQRGRLQYQAGGSPVHALAAFAHERGVVLAQEPIDRDATKSEAELTVAPALLARVDWRGRVLTGDALFCQRHLCRQVLRAGGDYLLVVKANQPALHQDLVRLFDRLPGTPPPLPLLDRREARTRECGHGRQDEVRHLIASTDLAGYLDWPGAAQVFRVERTWRERGRPRGQVRYGITSLPPAVGTAARLLELKRGHWAIENRLHRPKDVALGEDASLVHVGQGPTVLAMLRDTAISLLHRAGVRALTARLRQHSQHPEAAVALVCGPPPTHA
jgi:predicted transposase YbfD/YdcC